MALRSPHFNIYAQAGYQPNWVPLMVVIVGA